MDETTGTFTDTDGDGVTDSFMSDTNADGVPDVLIVDTDGDQAVDTMAFDTDYDGITDLSIDQYGNVITDDTTTEEPVTEEPVIVEDLGTETPVEPDYTVEDVETSQVYQDYQAGTGEVHGDLSDANFWFLQSGNTCGPSAATQIIEDFTGADLGNEAALLDYAVEQGWTLDGGLQSDQLPHLLTAFGVPSTMLYDQTFDDVERYLDEGRAVILTVDAFDYWDDGGTPFPDETENSAEDLTNHFTRIIAIDQEQGVAILSDTGTPDGNMLEVPLEALEEAWNDLESPDSPVRNTLIVSDEADPTQDGAEGTEPVVTEPVVTEGVTYSEEGFAYIPVTLALSRIREALGLV